MAARKVAVAVVGKGGHAGRLIDLVRKHPKATLSCVYHPTKVGGSARPCTDDFAAVLAADAVIVASPTPTHAGYLRKLSRFQGRILVEKPAVSAAADIAELRKWPLARKRRVRINYNLAFSELYRHLARVARSPRLGTPLFLDVHVSYGPAFRPEYRTNWRTDRAQSLGALESIGVHFVNLALRLFGPVAASSASVRSAARKSASRVDTGLASFRTSSGVYVSLFHSHAAPYYFRMHLLGTNGYWEYDGREARLHSPRETLHADGSFAPPPLVERTALDHMKGSRASLESAVDSFIRAVGRGALFDAADFDLGLASMDPLLGARR